MTVSEQIIQVIEALCEKFGIAVDWTSQNVVPYLESLGRKLITYEIATSVVYIAIMVALSIASVIATKRLYPIFKKGLEEQDCLDCGWTVATVFAIIGLVIINTATLIVVGTQIVDIIKCVIFPEMYVFEYISTLIQ